MSSLETQCVYYMQLKEEAGYLVSVEEKSQDVVTQAEGAVVDTSHMYCQHPCSPM